MANTPVEPFSVTVHPFPSRTRKNCAYEMGNTSARNALVFIGGLKDGPHTTPYIWTVAKRLEEATQLGYSVFEIRMRSSFNGFGTSSLKKDVEDISSLVSYLRGRGKDKIVLMGHSTGCQVFHATVEAHREGYIVADIRINRTAWNTPTTSNTATSP